MTNKKGEMQIVTILMTFIAVIVGLILLQGSYPFIGASTNTYNLVNQTFTAPASGASIDLVGQELLGTAIVINRTTGTVVPATNYTIGERVSPVDGVKRIYYQSNGGSFNSVGVNISYPYGQEGYIEDAGGRGVTNLIPIMGALALIMAVLAWVFKEKFF